MKRKKRTDKLYSFVRKMASDDRITLVDRMQKQISYLQEKIAVYEEALRDGKRPVRYIFS